ncbi:hypothetical protein BYT27DRAFT_7187300 [Phlegmacium glaucopus]|nr:hypothetical protein BYT27DRAFT_7187300 [Phlegmacium glaucopus]
MSHYDESLLASAPKATKAQLQDGYNPDLLVEKNSSSVPASVIDPEAANHHANAVGREEGAVLPPTKKLPFHHTQKGIIVIVVLVVIIIAVVVGGAVGGTRAKHGSKIASNATSSATANASVIINGAAPASSTTGVAQGAGTQGSQADPTTKSTITVPSGIPGLGGNGR